MKKPLCVLFAAIAGLFFVTFVWGWDIGPLWSVFCMLVTVGLLVSIRNHMQDSWHGRLMVAAGVGIALSHAIYMQDHMTPLNVLVAPLLITYGVMVLYYGDGHVEGLLKLFMSHIGKIFFSVKHAFNAIAGLIPKQWNDLGLPKMHKNIVGGLLLGGIAVIFLIPILASADPIFSNIFSSGLSGIQNFFTWIGGLFGTSDIISKLIVFIIVMFVILSMLLYFSKEREEKEINGVSMAIERSTYIVMSSFIAVVYVLFAIIQIKYLFLGSALPEGLTYSEYAVNGFWQLTGISLINIFLILLAPRYHKNQSKNLYLLLMCVIFLCSMIIWCSGLLRLRLYIITYGLTFMRILPFSFIIYLGYGLLISFIGIRKHSLRRSNLLAYGLVIWYAVFQLMGVDTIIANYNIKRYIKGETAIMDVSYLVTDLSWDQMRATYNLDSLEAHWSNKSVSDPDIRKINIYKGNKGPLSEEDMIMNESFQSINE